MGKIYHITEDYNERSNNEDFMLEKAFKEGCEHGYRKAMQEFEGFNERTRNKYKEGFEEKIEKLKERFK